MYPDFFTREVIIDAWGDIDKCSALRTFIDMSGATDDEKIVMRACINAAASRNNTLLCFSTAMPPPGFVDVRCDTTQGVQHHITFGLLTY